MFNVTRGTLLIIIALYIYNYSIDQQFSVKIFLMKENINLMKKCRIKGLKLTPQSIRKVKKTIEYSYIQLDSLLIFHQDKVHPILFDDQFLSPETIDVFEYKGNKYAVEAA